MYTPNNIRFRIVSSNAIAQYKLDQAFDFNELVNNQEYSFTPESRELLLLHYELWFRYIVRVERILIKSESSAKKLGTLTDSFMVLGKDLVTEIEEVINSHPELFSKNICTLVKKAFRPYYDYIFSVIISTATDSMYVAFPKIVTAVSSSLHNMLFILQEIEHLTRCKLAPDHEICTHFISYTEETTAVKKASGVCPVLNRAEQYKQMFGVTQFVIKNYTQEDLETMCASCDKACQEAGVGVIRVDKVHDPLDHF